ncbi:MAG: anaerobic ribonucleoside-triphosphate reductase activating protein [Sphaerochaetaceae bacterium]
MKIMGLQKMTLLDYPGKVACTVFFGGCNFRCPYCHNASLVFDTGAPAVIGKTEFLSFLSRRTGLLDGVCITGGEPLLQKDMALFIKEIKAMGFLVKLDTNGSFPDRLRNILDHGLVDYVAMDIKNSKEQYGKTIGVPSVNLQGVEESVTLLRRGLVPYEFRTTLVRELHTEEDVKRIGVWLDGSENLFLQTFVDSGNLIGNTPLTPFSKQEMEHFAQLLRSYIRTVSIRGI